MIVEKDAYEIRCCGPDDCGEYGNPGLDGVRRRWCIGAECAGWRWVDVPNPAYDPTVHVQVYPGPRHPPTHIKSTTVGYCGLAGRP